MRKILLAPYGVAVCICCFLIAILTVGVTTPARAATLHFTIPHIQVRDTLPKEDTTVVISQNTYNNRFTGSSLTQAHRDTVSLKVISRQPYISLQQMLKGNVAGVYVQEPSGEPGTMQNIFIRGISSALLNKKDLYNSRPAIYLNGIPLSRDNPFAFDIQKYDFNRIGPATNLLATLDPGNIQSIKVIKDPAMLALLGPDAANGAVWITTKNAHSGHRQISINSYVGFAQKPVVDPINAAYENAFRKPYYDKFATPEEKLRYPAFLRDSTNTDYYGPSNWADLYYKNVPLYSVDLSLTGGSDRANFRFIVNDTRSGGTADGTGFNRYGASFFINMLPLKWLTASAMMNANKLLRDRNRNIRDRLAEVRYIPDLTNPLAPNKNVYGGYLSEFDNMIDENKTNTAQGYFKINVDLNKIQFNSSISFDYNEGVRNVFWPTTLLDGINFVSNYFGYNQRFIVSNSISYDVNAGTSHQLKFTGGQLFQEDIYKYDYAYAYNGPNDYIKINIHNPSDDNNTLSNAQYTPYVFPDKEQARLASYYAKADYTYNKVLNLSALVRSDGSSSEQPNHRWFLGYALSADWNMARSLLSGTDDSKILSLHASWGKIGKPFNDDRFAVGPQYKVDVGWPDEPALGSYVGIAGLSRPYTSGWVGYDIPWQYSDKLDVGINVGVFKNRLQASVDFYSNDDKNLLLPVSVPVEWGYTSAYESGMWINNTGVDVTLSADIIKNIKGLNWTFTANLNHNQNKLKALPDGLQQIIIGDRKLVVGKSVDSYWLLENKGIYNTDGEVPVNPQTNQPMTYNGVALKGGDAKWEDINGDHVISNDDKQLMGHFMPSFSGGFGSNLSYKAWTFNFNFYFVSGRDILNQNASSRLDFINNQSSNSINSVKEIWFWQKRMDPSKYPMYNPWSNAVPYQVDQDVFLQNGAFLKLRSLSLGYDLSQTNLFMRGKQKLFTQFLVYLSASNVFTISPFKDDDPELVNYNGIYDGYGLPIPRSIIFGVKIDM